MGKENKIAIVVEEKTPDISKGGGTIEKIAVALGVMVAVLFPGAALGWLLATIVSAEGTVQTALRFGPIILLPILVSLALLEDSPRSRALAQKLGYHHTQIFEDGLILSSILGGTAALVAGIVVVPLLWIGTGIITIAFGVSEVMEGHVNNQGFATFYLIWIGFGSLVGFLSRL